MAGSRRVILYGVLALLPGHVAAQTEPTTVAPIDITQTVTVLPSLTQTIVIRKRSRKTKTRRGR